MKSIEERAKEAYPAHEYSVLERVMKRGAYIRGAKEQKAIDDAEKHYKQGYYDAVERACDWLKKELQYLAIEELKDIFYKNEFKIILKSQVPDWLRDFRKAMEE